MALSTEKRGSYSDVAHEIRKSALGILASTGRKGMLLEAMRKSDAGNKTAVGELIDALGLPEEEKKLLWLGTQISFIEACTEEQRRIDGEPRGPVDIQVTFRGERINIPVLPAIESK